MHSLPVGFQPHLHILELTVGALQNGTLNSEGIAIDPTQELLILKVSRATAVILLFAFVLYVWFQMRTHHSLFDAVLELEDAKEKETDDVKSSKLTLIECLVALAIALTLVSVHAVFLGKPFYYCEFN